MTVHVIAGDADRSTVLMRLRADDPLLTAFGLACLMTAALTFALPLIDGRLIQGVSVWVKPAKFFVSVGVYALTFAWFTGYVSLERRQARPLRIGRAVIVGAGGLELGYITVQAAFGQASHFNDGDPLHAILYALMGIMALTLLAGKIPLIIEILRRPVQGLMPGLHLAALLGLTMTVILGAVTGIAISANHDHSVGSVGAGLPLLGWNRAGGDLRIAHFLGMHSEQILPLFASCLISLDLGRRLLPVTLAALLLFGLTMGAWLQAASGIAFPFG